MPTAFSYVSMLRFLLPSSCYLLVTYRMPTHQILARFTTSHSKFPFPVFGIKKSTATPEDYGTFKPFGTVNSQCILRTCYKFFRICLLSPLPQSELYS